MAAKPQQAANRPQIARIAPAGIHVEPLADGTWRWTHTPPPLEAVELNRRDPRLGVAWRPIWCAGYDVDVAGGKHYHHLECTPCHCKPGPQIWLTMCGAREIAALGSRGSAKSEGTFGFLTGGNLSLDLLTMRPGYDTANRQPVDTTYLSQPDYSFLVLRKNSRDLQSYFRRASRYFAQFGGQMTQEPMGVKFPSGAWGVFDHLADADAYEKYVGQEFTRIVVEEANQIPDEKRYLKIKASCRTSNPKMRPQIVLTFNPGGPGARWLKARFITPGGQRIPFGKMYADPFSGQTRIAIFSTVDDNPYALANEYDKELDSIRSEDSALYKQWRLGDFDVQSGQFFEMFREKRLEHEPENACHVVKPHALPGEWPTAICLDWGYSHPSAAYWLKWSPRKQLHTYREFVVARMGCRDLGAEIARRTLDDLASSTNPRFNLYLSHDAFHREHEGATEAELIQQGIDSILGAGAAFVFDANEEERLLERDVKWESVKRRALMRRKGTYITIINAGMKRRANLNLIRDYMRWMPIDQKSMEFNPEIYRNLLDMEGCYAAEEYERKCQIAPPIESLPVLRIHYDGDALDPRDRGCEKLVVAIQSMTEKEKDSEQMEKADGDDPVDALAYGVGNFNFQEGYVSDEEQLRRKIQSIRERTPGMDMNSLVRNAERLEAEHRAQHHGKGVTLQRLQRPRHVQRMVAGLR